jgi:hypothetical protein
MLPLLQHEYDMQKWNIGRVFDQQTSRTRHRGNQQAANARQSQDADYSSNYVHDIQPVVRLHI